MTSDDPEAVLRAQFETTFGKATYPVTDPFELIPVLPEGPATEFEADGITIPAIELGLTYGEYQSYPYQSVDELVTDLLFGLKSEGVL